MHDLAPPLSGFINFKSTANRTCRGAGRTVRSYSENLHLARPSFPSEHHINGIQYHNQLESPHPMVHLGVMLRNGLLIDTFYLPSNSSIHGASVTKGLLSV